MFFNCSTMVFEIDFHRLVLSLGIVLVSKVSVHSSFGQVLALDIIVTDKMKIKALLMTFSCFLWSVSTCC